MLNKEYHIVLTPLIVIKIIFILIVIAAISSVVAIVVKRIHEHGRRQGRKEVEKSLDIKGARISYLVEESKGRNQQR